MRQLHHTLWLLPPMFQGWAIINFRVSHKITVYLFCKPQQCTGKYVAIAADIGTLNRDDVSDGLSAFMLNRKSRRYQLLSRFWEHLYKEMWRTSDKKKFNRWCHLRSRFRSPKDPDLDVLIVHCARCSSHRHVTFCTVHFVKRNANQWTSKVFFLDFSFTTFLCRKCLWITIYHFEFDALTSFVHILF